MKTKYYIIVFAFIFIKLKAQITYGGEPYTSLVNTTNTTLASYISLSPTIASYSLPAYDNTTLKMRSDSIVNSCTQCGKKLYGTGVEQTIDLMSQGTYQLIGNTKVYRFLVHSDNALGLQFYFSKFKLPESGSLFFYPPDKSYMYGALTQFSNWKDTLRDDSSKIAMATVPLLGNEWVLEYNEDVSAEFSAQIEISIIVHGYDGQVLSRIAEGPVNCQVDVACEEANYDIECEKESTLMMLFLDNGGAHSHWAGYCTGNLINTANDSEIPYVMTAGHCFNDANNQAMLYDPHGLIFVFKYEGDNCENDGSSEPYDQRYSTFGGGPIVVKNLQASYDYALVKLTGISKEILSDWGVCYAGWDNRTTLSAAPPYVLIHHAEGKEKKISITPASEQLESVTYITDATTVSTAGFYRSHWDVGVPEFGSGGASLFDQNHRIIATYNGYDPVAQTAACVSGVYNGDYDRFSKFSSSYVNGNFAQWLDPDHPIPATTYVDCNCPDPETPDYEPQDDPEGTVQFYVNGKSNFSGEAVNVCTSNINLTPVGIHWLFTNTEHDNALLNHVPNLSQCAYKIHDYVGYWLIWEVYYTSFSISIQQCNSTFAPIGPLYSQSFFYYDNDQNTGNEFSYTGPLNLANYMPSGCTLQDGNYYKITYTAQSPQNGGAYISGSEYIKTFAQDLNIQNETINYDEVAGHDITIANCTTNSGSNIEVLAGNSIKVSSTSTLHKGRYHIGPVDCNSIGNYRTTDESSATHGGKNQSAGSSVATATKADVKPVASLLKKSDEVIISPNPNNGNFTIMTNGRAGTLKSIDILNAFGVVLQTLSGQDSMMEINIQDQPAGLYFVKLNYADKTVTKKVVKQ